MVSRSSNLAHGSVCASLRTVTSNRRSGRWGAQGARLSLPQELPQPQGDAIRAGSRHVPAGVMRSEPGPQSRTFTYVGMLERYPASNPQGDCAVQGRDAL